MQATEYVMMDVRFIGLLAVSILLTALAYVVGIYVATKHVRLKGPLLIGFVVVLAGYLTSYAGTPIWLVIMVLVLIGFLMLTYLLKDIRKTVTAYALTWAAYLVFHVLLSSVARYDSLIPAWRLHS